MGLSSLELNHSDVNAEYRNFYKYEFFSYRDIRNT
jgi:hypothetical protein